MKRECVRRKLAMVVLAGMVLGLGTVHAQDLVLQGRAPRFFYTPTPGATPRAIDVSAVRLLHNRLSLDLEGVTLSDALAAITQQTGLQFVYSADVIPADALVQLRAQDITVAAALTEILLDTGIDVLLSPGGQLALVKRPGPPQTGSVAGRVTDARTGGGVSNVLIAIVGTRLTATTSDSGLYRIVQVPPGRYSVTARRIGYTTVTQALEITADAEATLDFALSAAPSELDAIVVTVTGEQRRAVIGNALGIVKADSLVAVAPVKTFDDLLTARIPGVDVRQASGFTGQATNIRIRGINSLTTSNEPIIIVDGVRIDNTPGDIALNTDGSFTPGYTAIFASYGQLSGSLASLTPDEIESVEVVKGASAATLYGTDAANGVIVIKTKRGMVGRPQLKVYTEAGILNAAGPTYTNYYAWGHSLSDGSPTQCLLQWKAAGLCAIDSVTHFNPLENPQTTVFGTGNRQQSGAQLSGGTRALRYFVSGDFERELGYLQMPAFDRQRLTLERGAAPPEYETRPNELRKLSLRGNVVSDLGGKGDVTISTGFINNLVRIPGTIAIESAAYGLGYRDSTLQGYNQFYGLPGDLFSVKGDQHIDRFTGSVALNYRPLAWLATRGTVGTDLTNTFLDGLQLTGEGPVFGRRGSRWNSRNATTLLSIDLGANATAQLSPDLKSTTAVGAQYSRQRFGSTVAAGVGLIPGVQTGTGAQSQYIVEVNQEKIVAGTYVEQTLGLRDRLFLTAGLRGDGSSGFGSNFRTALYPKASASWIISKEPFLWRTSTWLQSLRFRAAFGSSGVQPDPTAQLAHVTVLNGLVDGQVQNGTYVTALANPNLKAERQTEFEGGADAELWHGRARLEATYYSRHSSDALLSVALAGSVGVSGQLQNVGGVRNRGVEGSINVQVLNLLHTTLDLGVNGWVNHSRVLALSPGVSALDASPGFLPTSSRIGYPMYAVWARPLLGYRDANGDGILTPDEVTVGDTAVFMGPTLPTRELAGTATLSLFGGRVRVSSLFDHRGGFKHLDEGSGGSRCPFFLNCREVNDPGTPLADQAREVWREVTGNYVFIYDGAYVRWRELAVTLSAPDRWAHAMGAQSAAITISGRNLALWTKTPGIDPEQQYLDNAVSSGYNAPNIIYGVPTAPAARYWIARVNLAF